MLLSYHIQSLKDYFARSEQFFFVLIDRSFRIAYVNPLFTDTFYHSSPDVPGQAATTVFEDYTAGIRSVTEECFNNPGVTLHAEIVTRSADNILCKIKWEFSANPEPDGSAEYVQAVGVLIHGEEIQHKATRLPGKLPERYKAYEQSAEGLWMFELDEPVEINKTAEEIIAHWREHAYIADCNMTLARMYGFDEPREIMGSKPDDFMDFTDPELLRRVHQFIRNGFEAKGFESTEKDKEGNTVYFRNNMTGVVENGVLLRIWGTQQDITIQKKAEQRLQQSELFYRNLFSNSLDGLLITDQTGMITFASASVTQILGYEVDELIGKLTFDFAHPDDRQLAVSAFMDEVKEVPVRKFISIRLRNKQGEWIWCIVRGHNLMQNPYVQGILVYFYDDTMRKQTEQALIDSEKRSRIQANILTNVTDVIITTDLDRVITSWNKVIEKLTGIPEEEAVGKLFRQIVHADFSPYTHDQVAEIVFREGIWKGEMNIVGAGGEKKHLLHTISMLHDAEGNNIGLLGVGRDITERKKAQAKLQESELFYRSLISYSLDGIVMTDAGGLITYCGPSVTKLSGYEPSQLLGHHLFEFVHPDDIPVAVDAFQAEISKQSVVNYMVLRLMHSSGLPVWCTVRGHNLLDNPVVKSMVIYFADDSKRKEAEDKLRQSEQHFRNLIFNLKQGIILQGADGRMIVCNQAALDMLGVTEDQLIGQSPIGPGWNIIHEDGRSFTPSLHPANIAFETKKPVRDVVMGVWRPVTGDRVWLLVNAEPVLDHHGDLLNVICSYTDITEQKKLSQALIEQEIQKQKQLTQATIDGQEKERQEIGKELHDNINQHLNTTRLYLEVAREKASGEVLEMIHLSHKNLISIVDEIRQLSQSLVPPTLGDLGLVESIHDLCDSLKRGYPFNIEFLYRHFSEEKMPGNMKLMLFRIVQEQVNNIIRHAHAKNIQIRLQSDAEYVILTIADDGEGFDPVTYRKGLGFSNISNRATLFNGKMEIDAAPGRGCAVTVIIPFDRE